MQSPSWQLGGRSGLRTDREDCGWGLTRPALAAGVHRLVVSNAEIRSTRQSTAIQMILHTQPDGQPRDLSHLASRCVISVHARRIPRRRLQLRPNGKRKPNGNQIRISGTETPIRVHPIPLVVCRVKSLIALVTL